MESWLKRSGRIFSRRVYIWSEGVWKRAWKARSQWFKSWDYPMETVDVVWDCGAWKAARLLEEGPSMGRVRTG